MIQTFDNDMLYQKIGISPSFSTGRKKYMNSLGYQSSAWCCTNCQMVPFYFNTRNTSAIVRQVEENGFPEIHIAVTEDMHKTYWFKPEEYKLVVKYLKEYLHTHCGNMSLQDFSCSLEGSQLHQALYDLNAEEVA